MAGLVQEGLSSVAPGVVGDYFPGSTPQQLAEKSNVCTGASPQGHSHFFTEDGRFGSLDQDGNQVDDGSYQVAIHTIHIGDGTFRYHIVDAKLVLRPVILARDRHRALADPLKFSTAGWQVAVSYAGLPWTRVPCDDWC